MADGKSKSPDTEASTPPSLCGRHSLGLSVPIRSIGPAPGWPRDPTQPAGGWPKDLAQPAAGAPKSEQFELFVDLLLLLEQRNSRPKPRGRQGRPPDHPQDKKPRLIVLFAKMISDGAVSRDMQPGEVVAVADKDSRYRKSYREIDPRRTTYQNAWKTARRNRE